MAIDARKLTRYDWGVMGGGAVALVSLFLPWYGASVGPFSATVSGWSTTYGWIGGVLLVAAAAWFTLERAKVPLPKLPVGPLSLTAAASVLGLAIVAIRWATLPRGGISGMSFDYGGRYGIWIAIIAGVVEVASVALILRHSGEHLPKFRGWTHHPPPATPKP